MPTSSEKAAENVSKEAQQTEKTKEKGKGKKDEKKQELSEEDLKKKEELDLLVTRAQDSDEGVQRLALNSLITEVRSSTASMTSVPKALKFLRAHYNTLKTYAQTLADGQNKRLLCDILSVLAMTFAQETTRECLQFRLGGSPKGLTEWGHEYVKYIAGEISQEFEARSSEEGRSVDDLLELVREAVEFNMKHNAEADACDLLTEVGRLEWLESYCDEANYGRVCLYLLGMANYLPFPEDIAVLRVAYGIFRKVGRFPEALRVALHINDRDLILSTYKECTDPLVRKQMGFTLARLHVLIDAEDDDENAIIGNVRLNEYFLHLAKDLDVLEPKTPEDIYKSHLSESRPGNVDSARQNLASTFVNGFVNASFCKDKLISVEDSNNWIYKNKDHGMMSAVASLGMIMMWDVDNGLNALDKFTYSDVEYIKAGSLMGIGLLCSGIRHESDPALAVLQEHVSGDKRDIRIGAILGLGIAYAGAARDDVSEVLLPILLDSSQSLEIHAFCALALGMVFAGTCSSDISEAIAEALMLREEKDLEDTLVRFLCLGLGLLFLGKQEAAEATIEVTKTLNEKVAKLAEITVDTCAYAGTCNVLKIQQLLHLCAEHLEAEAAANPPAAGNGGASGQPAAAPAMPGATGPAGAGAAAAAPAKPPAPASKTRHQSAAVLGIAAIAMGEELGAEMAIRSMEHLLQYGDVVIKRAVPIALGLLNISNPRMSVMDTLSKFSHDTDAEVAQSSILALGLLGAGTNNARVAQLLRQLTAYYAKDANHLFMVRLAQGLLFAGKGTMSLNPYVSDRMLMSVVAMSGLLCVSHSCLDLKNIILSKYHYLLYFLAPAMYPRMLLAVNEDLQPIPVSARVGTAVDVVAQAGRPKTITGAQTHNTPVLIGHGERAELATEEYIPMTTVLESVVIMKKNPEYRS